jgi:carboxylesterase
MAIEWAWLRGRGARDASEADSCPALGTGPMVLLLHGLTGSPSELAYVARRMRVASDSTVWCPRLVNHGAPLNVLAATRSAQLYESARTYFLAAQQAASEAGVPLVVGGLSLGAVLALLLAVEFPASVAGVICLAPTLFYDGWNVPWLRRMIPLIDYTPLKYFAYFREEPPYGLKDESLRERVADAYESVSLRDNVDFGQHGYAHFPIRLLCESRHLIARCVAALRHVKAPLLIVQARDDDATSPRNSRHIFDNVSSMQKEVLLLDNSFHIVTADLERDHVASAMARFCQRLIDQTNLRFQTHANPA